MAQKIITIESRDVKALIELMNRGLAYTDAHYRDNVKMENLFAKVIKQFKKDK